MKMSKVDASLLIINFQKYYGKEKSSKGSKEDNKEVFKEEGKKAPIR
jgi:hypothetical protein